MRLAEARARFLALTAALAALFAGGAHAAVVACGPFTDVAVDAFCPFVLEIFYMGITTGTTPTTYDPGANISRLQMAAFLSRAADAVQRRGNRRAALKQFWTPQNKDNLAVTTVGAAPNFVESDGQDLWASSLAGTISRVRGGDGRLLETWTGATNAEGIAIGIGSIFVAGFGQPSRLYKINPTQAAGAVTTVSSNLGDSAYGAAYDGSRIWTANNNGTVSMVTPGASIPWSVATTAAGFLALKGILFDGSNIWVTDSQAGLLLKLSGSGSILQTVTVGADPYFPGFDGTNIWVPNLGSSTVTVVRASSGAVLATLTGNGLGATIMAAFDGQRVLVTNGGANTVSLFKAADFSPLGSFSTGPGTIPAGACSDGVNFWIAPNTASSIARF